MVAFSDEYHEAELASAQRCVELCEERRALISSIKEDAQTQVEHLKLALADEREVVRKRLAMAGVDESSFDGIPLVKKRSLDEMISKDPVVADANRAFGQAENFLKNSFAFNTEVDAIEDAIEALKALVEKRLPILA